MGRSRIERPEGHMDTGHSLFAWSQLNFSAIPVSISAVSLRKLTTYILLDFNVAK
jgi:hypothetical protein